jgi:hypothetical protein
VSKSSESTPTLKPKNCSTNRKETKAMPIEILTPPGRIVWGHPLIKQIKTDPKTRKPILDKAGQEQDVWSYGLAIPNHLFAPVEQAIAQAGYQQYPNGQFPRDFAWKIKRETDRDQDNKLYGEREGYAGHTVINISTQAFCPPAFKFENGAYRQLTEKEIKTGDWGVAKLMINSHPGGIYINPVAFELVGYDKEIVSRSAANPNETFGGRTYQLPPGVSATPVGGGHGVGMPQTAPAPATHVPAQPAPANYAIPGQPAPAASYAPQPVAHTAPAPVNYQPAPPAHDFVHAATGQPPANYAIPGQPAPAASYAPQPVAGMPGQPAPAAGYAVPGMIPGR